MSDKIRMSFDALPLTRRLLAQRREKTGENLTDIMDGVTACFYSLPEQERYDCYLLVESLWKGATPPALRNHYERRSMLLNAGVLLYLGGIVRAADGFQIAPLRACRKRRN